MRFAATRWSLVRAAADDGTGTASRRALEELIQAYWFPLYAFVRRRGRSPVEAEDAVQELFAGLLADRSLGRADRAKGKFRTFLLAAMKHYLAKQRARNRAQKRGGGRPVIALDALDAETRYALEPADDMTPERLFDRRWALTVLDQVLTCLAAEYAHKGNARLYEALEPCLSGGARAIDYGRASRDLRTTPGALRTAAHRLRRRYRALLQQEIAQTVDSPEQVDEEIAYLLKCL